LAARGGRLRSPLWPLTLPDGKYVELASWVGCAARTVGPNQDECIDVLRVLVKEMDDRYLLLVANRQRRIHQGDGWKLHVIVCDELAFYLTPPTATPTRKPAT
jgi:hypothetical protein